MREAPPARPADFATRGDYLNWAADQALAWYDQGRPKEARALFGHLLGQHPALSHVNDSPEFTGELVASVYNGREAFERYMRGLLG